MVKKPKDGSPPENVWMVGDIDGNDSIKTFSHNNHSSIFRLNSQQWTNKGEG